MQLFATSRTSRMPWVFTSRCSCSWYVLVVLVVLLAALRSPELVRSCVRITDVRYHLLHAKGFRLVDCTWTWVIDYTHLWWCVWYTLATAIGILVVRRAATLAHSQPTNVERVLETQRATH